MSDEEDPLETNLRVCRSENIPTVDRHVFKPNCYPGVNVNNLRNLSCAEVMEKYHPSSLFQRFAEQSNGYFYRLQHSMNDLEDEEEA